MVLHDFCYEVTQHSTHAKAKPVERQGRKATDLKRSYLKTVSNQLAA